jgi:hypothetical protein
LSLTAKKKNDDSIFIEENFSALHSIRVGDDLISLDKEDSQTSHAKEDSFSYYRGTQEHLETKQSNFYNPIKRPLESSCNVKLTTNSYDNYLQNEVFHRSSISPHSSDSS